MKKEILEMRRKDLTKLGRVAVEAQKMVESIQHLAKKDGEQENLKPIKTNDDLKGLETDGKRMQGKPHFGEKMILNEGEKSARKLNLNEKGKEQKNDREENSGGKVEGMLKKFLEMVRGGKVDEKEEKGEKKLKVGSERKLEADTEKESNQGTDLQVHGDLKMKASQEEIKTEKSKI